MNFRYKQTFDEIIRQVTIHCSERGLLMLRVRDEINMTLEVRFDFIVSVFIMVLGVQDHLRIINWLRL